MRSLFRAVSAIGSGRLFRWRPERFGGIVQLGWPRALVFVDRSLGRSLGHGSQLWYGAEPEVGDEVLSSPLEAHLQLTNRCDVGCQGCYTGATPSASKMEWGLEEWKVAIDELAAMRVFHLALGGGESADLPWLGDIARYARERGMTPNLTTSGLSGLDRLVPIADVFGQINVSIDGLGDTYRAVRGVDGFSRADRAIQRLRAVKRQIGINVVVTRANFDELDALFAYAKKRRLNGVELLRFKPSGRGRQVYEALRCTDAQHLSFFDTIKRAVRVHRVRARVDCSYTPMLAHGNPDRELLAQLCVYGCTAGDFLVGAKATGQVTGCSFASAEPTRPKLSTLRDYWHSEGAFARYRDWRSPQEPCRSCDYHSLCRGGCKVVSEHVCGDASAPDPECPRVVATQAPGRKRLPVVI